MPGDLAGLIKKRKTVLTRVKTLYSIAEKAMTNEKEKKKLQTRFEQLGPWINEFESLNMEIVALSPDEKVDSEIAVLEEFDGIQFTIKQIFKELFPPVVSAETVNSERDSNVSLCGHTKGLIKPRLDIPCFDGDRRNWNTFFDMFSQLVDQEPDYPDISKFQLLVSSLKGEAAEVIKNIPIQGRNYAVAFQALVKRYQNDRLFLTDYWLAIVNAAPAKNNSACELRSLISTFNQNLEALDVYKDIDLWDFTKLNLLLQKIDPFLKTRFEIEHSNEKIPTYKSLIEFLETNCHALENSALLSRSSFTCASVPGNSSLGGSRYKKSSMPGRSYNHTSGSKQVLLTGSSVGSVKCPCCQKSDTHSLLKCDKFLEMDPYQRHAYAKSKKLCFLCLSSLHVLKDCPTSESCGVCKGTNHSSLLHFPRRGVPRTSGTSLSELSRATSGLVVHSEDMIEQKEGVKVNVCQNKISNFKSVKTVLFATARVFVSDKQGSLVACRALLDSASEASFVTISCAQKLGFPCVGGSTPLVGLNNMTTSVSFGNIVVNLSSNIDTSFSIELNAIVVPLICGLTPSNNVGDSWKYLSGLTLADPEYGTPRDVDLLLGADVFSQVVMPGFKKGQNGGPSAMNTVFGYVLVGGVERPFMSNDKRVIKTYLTSVGDVSESLQRFWQLESVPSEIPLCRDDEKCEKLFKEQHSRDESGRYIVRLPFCEQASLGDSRNQALRRFYLLEGRLLKNPSFHNAYLEFMQDYLDQNHMSLVTSGDVGKYYIPHHGIWKECGDHSKKNIRVVFDGSAKSTNNKSINDILLTGQKLQNDIVSILLNFRVKKVIFTTDIRQMYRNILVNPEDISYQTIFWRFNQTEPVQEYVLRTVTYGLNCSPFLAIRTLLQLAEDHGEKYPLAAHILRCQTYVDDAVGTADSLAEAFEIQHQLIELMACGGFELRKWASNCRELIANVPESHLQSISFDDSNSVLKVLGLQWNPLRDVFSYRVDPQEKPCTKRNILSQIARIYDPLGFLSPVVFVAKSLMQKLWLQGLSFDDCPDQEIVDQWNLYTSQLPILSSLFIPRRATMDNVIQSDIHGFCDASMLGYGGVVYLRQIDSFGEISVHLLCAKNKVAPLKTISVPRLELCAAHLLSNLIRFVLNNLRDVRVDNVLAWSDSTVTLAWIKDHPSKWKVFVANRVTQIQEILPPSCWNHVEGKTNPADCLSRGLLPNDFMSHSLWFQGPEWLYLPNEQWPISKEIDCELVQINAEQKVKTFVTEILSNVLEDLMNRFSSFRKIQNIVAYLVRPFRVRESKETVSSKALCFEELHHAEVVLVRHVQQLCFSEDIQKLTNNESCSKSLRKLAPFIDRLGVVRVGGRLRHTDDLSYESKHPMLLPRNHRLAILIIEHIHRENGHPGPRMMHYLVVQKFWILSVKRAIHTVLSKCYKCYRTKPVPFSPYMGNLPKARISQLKPFSHSAVDYMGPFNIVISRARGVRSQKAYGCIFVCLPTKAVHLELVSDLTSDAFLAALRRFVARRGRLLELYSDQGTNFKGAKNLLDSYCQKASEALAIKWNFNPPGAPHFGGLHEAGVKSTKSHLLRMVGEQILTFEELSTLLAQIEAILNSRPLCSVSPDPNDLSCLTPGHFLTLEPLTAPPDEDVLGIKVGRLNRWQLVQQLHQSFWQRWHMEYLHQLQVRQKWNTPEQPPQVGSLVVIKEENTPPLRWSLARISKVYKSPDGISRVVQVQTSKGLFDRPLVKVCPLPSQ